MARESGPEAELYPIIQRWATKSGCWETRIDVGLKLGRIDVVGIRELGGDLTSRSEVVSIEVKSSSNSRRFAASAGQAHGYSVMADRCYLAIDRTFDKIETAVASQLGIGLLSISKGHRVTEVLTAPAREPVSDLREQVVAKLDCASCTMCSSVFRTGSGSKPLDLVVRGTGATKATLAKAVEEEKGFVWWLDRLDWVHDKSGRAYVYRRRFMCPDCVQVFAQR